MTGAVQLNPSQQAGVDHRSSPLLLLAGAGTGKTRVITHRVAALLEEGVRPWEILAVTFTNKAAAEMRERIEGLCAARPNLQPEMVRDLWVGTFHAICARILRRHGEVLGLSRRFTIYDTDDQRTLMRNVLKDMKVSKDLATPGVVLSTIDRAKNRGFGRSQLDRLGVEDPLRDTVAEAWKAYEERCRAADACDFGDLLVLTVRLLERASEGDGQLADLDPVARLCSRFRHVVVDEYQDTNPVQARLVELLSPRAELCVVGDDDQAIYGWRGADVAQILDFPQRHPDTRVIRLEQNYRSTEFILRCADAVIRRNQDRLGKTLWSDLGAGEPVRVACLRDEKAEASFVAQWIRNALDEGADGEDIAVFYRTHAQSRVLEEQLRREGIGYRIVGGIRFYERREIKDLVAYLRLMITPNSDLDVLRVINTPRRGIGKKSIDALQAHAAALGVSLHEAMGKLEGASLGKAALRKISQFRALLDEFAEARGDRSLDELAEFVLERVGYRDHLFSSSGDEQVQAETRFENLQEFVGSLAAFSEERPDADLAEYLEEISLATSGDETDLSDAITLMTVHSAKGLEFEWVILCGMEERIFPHVRSLDDPVQMEEERRLAYVAVTRAKRNLLVTLAETRTIYGQTQVNHASRFVGDLPRDAIMELGGRPRGRLPTRSAAARPAFGASGARSEPQPERWNSDIELDADYQEGPPQGDIDIDLGPAEGEGVAMYVGMQIRHRKFGVGSVLGWSGHGANLKLELRFPEHGSKTVLARFCEPL
jgi:DNA helicase-2/ATP-dependent DNA helicase PcrA